MLETIRTELAAAIGSALAAMGVEAPQVALDVPPRRQLGDLAWSGALPLAKALRRAPRAIADEVAGRLNEARAALAPDHPLAMLEPGCAVEGPGFLNFRLRRGAALARLLHEMREPGSTPGERGGPGGVAKAGGSGGGPKCPPKVMDMREPGSTPGERGGPGGVAKAGGSGGGPKCPPKVMDMREPGSTPGERGGPGGVAKAGGSGGGPKCPPKVMDMREPGSTPGERGGPGGVAKAGDSGGGPKCPPKVIVEHTNINPNKAAHIGHLRNAVLGDTLVRCLRYLGHPVEVQDYIDDTGVQVADVVVGFLFLPEESLVASVAAAWPGLGPAPSRAGVLAAFVARSAAGTLVTGTLGEADFDDLCWDLYPRVTRWYEGNESAAARRVEVLHAIEAGFPPELSLAVAVERLGVPDPRPRTPDPASVACLAAAVAEANVRCHLVTMGRLGIAYDVLPHESDILHRGFWQRAFELLQAAGAIRLESEGKNAGCWVMSLADSPEFAGMADADKILLRSNGTVTYTGKDIAYQLWKLGLLRDAGGGLHDFGYRSFARFAHDTTAGPVRYGEGGCTLYRTASDPGERPAGVVFGAGGRVYNVIDVRQSYPQKVVKEAIRVLGHAEAAENSIHFAYEMVALTPKAVRRLEETHGLDFGLTAEDMAKPFLEMSGRRGIGVAADALLVTLVREAERAIADRQGEGPALAPEVVAARARAIAVGALRYQMARQGRNRVLAFDFDEALAFEGDTGPYLQYSAVRAAKVFEKLAAQGLAGSPETDAEAAAAAAVPDDLWELAFACARTREVVGKALASLEFSLLAGHTRDLAQLFHKLYHEHSVLHAEDEGIRALRRGVFRLFGATIREILEELLGIPVPAEM